jgi:hypothetical protein
VGGIHKIQLIHSFQEEILGLLNPPFQMMIWVILLLLPLSQMMKWMRFLLLFLLFKMMKWVISLLQIFQMTIHLVQNVKAHMIALILLPRCALMADVLKESVDPELGDAGKENFVANLCVFNWIVHKVRNAPKGMCV